ncbi:MAG: helix-turn-helix domain-containing protein [Sphingomonadales bacterium]|nr:helix-turn-helix domain-containing protein [Sphingomonadales bacterium]MBK8860319.1 helix-turn-helix domain-containing protein [Sphingomonadales bacterium]MBL0114474.1 helix-turn-helix domain-containing protein [Sphingomonadales bacterium]
MNRSQSDSERLLAVLKRELKSHGWTGARIARTLSIGEATVKRWLAGKSATICGSACKKDPVMGVIGV